MTYCIGLASLFVALFCALTIQPLENQTFMTICMIALHTLFMVTLGVASALEEKLVARIKALEDKLKDKEKTNGKT